MDTMIGSPRSTHPVLARVGALLVAVPLIAGAAASLMGLAGSSASPSTLRHQARSGGALDGGGRPP